MVVREDVSYCRVRCRECRIELDRAPRRGLGFRVRVARRQIIVEGADGIGVAKPDVGTRVVWLAGNCLAEMLDGPRKTLSRALVPCVATLEVEIVCDRIPRRSLGQRHPLVRSERPHEPGGDRAGDLLLNGEDLRRLTVVCG